MIQQTNRRTVGVICMTLAGVIFYLIARTHIPSQILSARRWDKLYQVVFLFPAVLGLAYLISTRVRTRITTVRTMINDHRAALILVCSGFLLLMYTAYFPLGHMPRSKDEAQYLFQGRLLVSGNLWAPSPPCHQAFTLRGIKIDGDRWVPAYDPGHSLLIGIGDHFNAGWMVGPFIGALFLWLLWLLGKELYGSRITIFAVFLGILSPFFIFLAASYSYHITSLCLTTVTLLGTAKRQSGSKWAFVTGVGLGLLVLVRPLAVVFIAPSLIYLEVSYIRDHRSIPFHRWWRIGIVMFPLILLYLLYNNVVTGNPFITGRQFLYPQALFGFGERAAHVETYGTLGHSPLKGLLNVLVQVSTLSTGLYGWPLISLFPAGIAFVLKKRTAWDWAFFIVMATTATVLFFSWYSAIEHGPRHYLDTLPGLLLLSSVGLKMIHDRIKQVGTMSPDIFMTIMLIGLFTITLILYIPVRVRDISGPWLGVDPVIRTAIDEDIDTPALVFMDYPDAPADYYTSGFVFNDPFLRAPVLFARHMSTGDDIRCLEQFNDRKGYHLRYDPDTRDIEVSMMSHEPNPKNR